ncbi:MAG: hypothetical protein KJZ86_08605 [Caldilineaceae bacterium]|nr:hypothetical protein [Caldilineaceae bacterium]
MPVNTNAVVLRTQPGAELTCKGHNYNLPPGDAAQRRGVLAYYATAALPATHSLADWLARIEIHMQQDVDAGHLPVFYRPQLQLLGDGEQSVL